MQMNPLNLGPSCWKPAQDLRRDFLAQFAEPHPSVILLHHAAISERRVCACPNRNPRHAPEQVQVRHPRGGPPDDLGHARALRPAYLHSTRPLLVEFENLYAKLVKQTEAGAEYLNPMVRETDHDAGMRGLFKQRMLMDGWPIEDLGGFRQGDPLPMSLRQRDVVQRRAVCAALLPRRSRQPLAYGRQASGWTRRWSCHAARAKRSSRCSRWQRSSSARSWSATTKPRSTSGFVS